MTRWLFAASRLPNRCNPHIHRTTACLPPPPGHQAKVVRSVCVPICATPRWWRCGKSMHTANFRPCRKPFSVSSFKAETISASFRTAIDVRFGHSQTCFNGCKIPVLFDSLFCNNHYPVGMWMVSVMLVSVVMPMRGARGKQYAYPYYQGKRPASLIYFHDS